jgi:hypothetical protein
VLTMCCVNAHGSLIKLTCFLYSTLRYASNRETLVFLEELHL